MQQYFVDPFTTLIHVFAQYMNGNFGLSIILITLLIRMALVPLMLRQYKNQQIMKEKMELLKPEMNEVQEKLKTEQDPEKKQVLQKELFGLYKKHGVNPITGMGCLPLLIQMPILMAFYFAIRGSEEIGTHSFLWFSLGSPDIWLIMIAGIIYYFQSKVTQSSLPLEQQKQMKFMVYLSPIMIILISLNAPAALPLYWSVGGLFLIAQIRLAQKLYNKEDKLTTITPPSS